MVQSAVTGRRLYKSPFSEPPQPVTLRMLYPGSGVIANAAGDVLFTTGCGVDGEILPPVPAVGVTVYTLPLMVKPASLTSYCNALRALLILTRQPLLAEAGVSAGIVQL
jgi:hypothetical protein